MTSRTVLFLVVLAGCGRAREADPQPAPPTFPARADSTPAHDWVHVMGDKRGQELRGLAVDRDGDVVIVGLASGEIDFGDGARDAGGDPAMFVAKYTPAGRLAWAHTYGRDAVAQAVAVLPDGHIVVAGSARPPIDLGQGPVALDTAGPAMLLLELASDGQTVGARLFGDPKHGDGELAADALAIAPDGDWIVAGHAARSFDLGTGPRTFAGVAPFVARYARGGSARWVVAPSLAPQVSGTARALAVARSGDLFVCGQSDGAPGAPAAGGRDAFVQRLVAGSGQVVWSQRFDSPRAGDCTALAAAGDDLYVAGALGGDVLVALDATGAKRWSRTTGAAHALTLDGDALVTAGVELDGRAPSIVIRRIAPSGEVRRETRYPGRARIRGLRVVGGALLLGGDLDGAGLVPTDLGTGPLLPAHDGADQLPLPDVLLARITFPS